MQVNKSIRVLIIFLTFIFTQCIQFNKLIPVAYRKKDSTEKSANQFQMVMTLQGVIQEQAHASQPCSAACDILNDDPNDCKACYNATYDPQCQTAADGGGQCSGQTDSVCIACYGGPVYCAQCHNATYCVLCDSMSENPNCLKCYTTIDSCLQYCVQCYMHADVCAQCHGVQETCIQCDGVAESGCQYCDGQMYAGSGGIN